MMKNFWRVAPLLALTFCAAIAGVIVGRAYLVPAGPVEKE